MSRRVLAQTDVLSSNSMIKALWRQLKHSWLFLNALDTFSRLRTLVEFYVIEHKRRVPHSAFDGQTPDEMYSGTGAKVADDLARQRSIARRDRVEANRARRCLTGAEERQEGGSDAETPQAPDHPALVEVDVS